jgi:hypothetical protein
MTHPRPRGRVVMVAVWTILLIQAGVARAEKKVTLCHHPPGNPTNSQTISVAESAIPAHLRSHGDSLGACPSGCTVGGNACDDGNSCTSDLCLPTGTCEHVAVGCDDGNPCTIDRCDPALGCLNLTNDGALCNDGNGCTAQDVCLAGRCAGSPMPDCCRTSTDCDDNIACTEDTCVSGICRHAEPNCAVSDKCTAGFCDPATGECAMASVNCDDGNVCTDDACDAVAGCISVPTTVSPEPREVSCADGTDNDCDGDVDSSDPDCRRLRGAACLTSLECDSGLLCVDGVCCTSACMEASSGCNLAVPGCSATGQCPTGAICFDGLCLANPCSVSTDCGAEGVCIQGRCSMVGLCTLCPPGEENPTCQ